MIVTKWNRGNVNFWKILAKEPTSFRCYYFRGHCRYLSRAIAKTSKSTTFLAHWMRIDRNSWAIVLKSKWHFLLLVEYLLFVFIIEWICIIWLWWCVWGGEIRYGFRRRRYFVSWRAGKVWCGTCKAPYEAVLVRVTQLNIDKSYLLRRWFWTFDAVRS